VISRTWHALAVTLTGMPAVAMSPKAGAHGELCGCMAIKAAIAARGEDRARSSRAGIGPWHQSRHGRLCGFTVDDPFPPTAEWPGGCRGPEGQAAGPDVAAIMLTNPNTCGLFEREIIEIAEAVHAAGAYFYCDGANFNAIVGRCAPAIWASMPCTSTCTRPSRRPHGGGGPGAGPVVLSEALAPFAPVPAVGADGEGLRLIEEHAGEAPEWPSRSAA
jgi:glycine dehydrogenase subunit 2